MKRPVKVIQVGRHGFLVGDNLVVLTPPDKLSTALRQHKQLLVRRGFRCEVRYDR